jgi:hypothetical protein
VSEPAAEEAEAAAAEEVTEDTAGEPGGTVAEAEETAADGSEEE